MRDQLTQYVHLLFAGTSESEEIQQEILQNTLDRYDDLISQGKSPEAAYRLAIAGIGDINEILGDGNNSTAPQASHPAHIPDMDDEGLAPKSSHKLMRAIAIGLYICCVIPLFVLSNAGAEILGLCLMFLMIAIATVLMVLSSNSKPEKEENDEKANRYAEKYPAYKVYKALSGVLTLCVYLLISFATHAWHITWLIFPISGVIDGIFRAILDLKEAKTA